MNAFTAPATGTPLVSFRQVRKHFAVDGRRLEAIQQFDLEIGEGEFIAIVGASGCGKSTLLRLLIGLDRDYDGEIRVDGRPIAGIGGERGIVFQEHRLFPWLTVQQNVALGLVNEALGETDKAARIDEYIRLVGLHGFERAYPHQLSGGMAQRVAIARGLVASPRLLLLDEPLSALDARIRKHLREQIRRIQQELGLTTVFVTHDQEEALTLSDRIVLMNAGRIVQSGDAETLYTAPENAFAAGFIGNYNLLDAEQASRLLGQPCAQQVAIRPESLRLGNEPSEGVPALVRSHSLLGNVIRYRVEAAGVELTVDVLNRSADRLYPASSQLTLVIDRNSIREVA
ncbi:spermidine/putrescine ABC transporter ATP-binding protein [Pseudomonas aeruginosa]|nr:spermidine/putrescine ABC transporter ATP-binding protein [Pseudomonas aeruginosa]